MQFRLDATRRLLRETKKSVVSVALDVGYHLVWSLERARGWIGRRSA